MQQSHDPRECPQTPAMDTRNVPKCVTVKRHQMINPKGASPNALTDEELQLATTTTTTINYQIPTSVHAINTPDVRKGQCATAR